MNLLDKRELNTYSNQLIENINLISFNNWKPSIMGTASLKSLLYNADVDLYSVIKYKSKNEALENIKKYFQKIIKRIALNKNVFFVDFKLGYNNNLYQNLNNLESIKKFYDDKKEYLTNEEYNKIKNIDNLDDLKEYTRKLYTLRWKPKEIIDGFKIINGDKKTIEESIEDKGVIKIDVLAYIDSEFVEMTNLFEFYIGNKPLNINENSNVLKQIKDDIKYYYDEKMFMKMLKRIFSLSKINKDKNTIKKLVEIFNSNLGLIYEVSSNLNNIITLTEKLNKSKLETLRNKIINYIQLLKDRLGNVYQFEFPNIIFEAFDKVSNFQDFDKMALYIDKIIKSLNHILNNEVLKEITRKKINYKKYLK